MCKRPKENKLGSPSEIPLRNGDNRDRERHRAEMGNTDLWKPRPSIRTTIHVFGKRISSRSKFFTYSYLPGLAHIPALSKLRKTYFELAMVSYIRVYIKEPV